MLMFPYSYPSNHQNRQQIFMKVFVIIMVTGGHLSLIHFSSLASVIQTWRLCELLRFKRCYTVVGNVDYSRNFA